MAKEAKQGIMPHEEEKYLDGTPFILIIATLGLDDQSYRLRIPVDRIVYHRRGHRLCLLGSVLDIQRICCRMVGIEIQKPKEARIMSGKPTLFGHLLGPVKTHRSIIPGSAIDVIVPKGCFINLCRPVQSIFQPVHDL